MSTELKELNHRLTKLSIINTEKILNKDRLNQRLDRLYSQNLEFTNEYETLRFIERTLADYYKIAREKNLNSLAERIGEFMEHILNKPYEVSIGIRKSGNYDYLDMNINGVPPIELSGGERQVLSLSMVAECITNNTLVLDETINSLDPWAQEKIVDYLKSLGETKQIFIMELDDNLDLEYTFIVEENTIKRGVFLSE